MEPQTTEQGIRALEVGMIQGKKFSLEESFAIGTILRRLSGSSWRGRLARRLIGFRLDGNKAG